MIRPRKHLENIERDEQLYNTRLDRLRLGFNEYVPYVNKKIYEKIFEKTNAEILSTYPSVKPAYEALSKYIGQPVSRLILTFGSDGGIFITLSAFCDPGDEVSIVSPTYGMYSVYAKMLNCKLNEVFYDENRKIDKSLLFGLLTPNTKVLAIANPNGITGESIPLDDILELTKSASKNGTIMLLDEAYVEFSKIKTDWLIDKFDNLVIIRSFSKSLGMAGLRIGYVLTNETVRKIIFKMKPVVEINSIAIEAVKTICENPELIEMSIQEIIDTKNYVSNAVREFGFEVFESETNFILINLKDKKDQFLKAMNDNKIEIKDLPKPYETFVRVTVGTIGIMKRFMEVFKKSI